MNKIIPIPAFNDNYIWLIINSQHQAIVIDPGDSTPVLNYCKQKCITLTHILITHHHADHTGGVKELVLASGATVYAPENTELTYCDHRLQDQDRIQIPSHELEFIAIATPGHTLDHICYYTFGHLFSGDTLFAGGCGRIFEGTPQMMYQSLQKLCQIPKETRLYCAHEYTLNNLKFAHHIEPDNAVIQQRLASVKQLRQQKQTTLPSIMESEYKTNPFIRCQHLTDAASRHSGQKVTDPASVFEIIREWKNNF
jgi:hydroxyacylglutathione hydrolase